jgi:hypothetical protein
MKAIKFAFDHWLSEFKRLSVDDKTSGAPIYSDEQYNRIGL